MMTRKVGGAPRADTVREKRIMMEIIVGAYTPSERTMG